MLSESSTMLPASASMLRSNFMKMAVFFAINQTFCFIDCIGAKDEIVPSWISKAFIDALGETTCARMIKVTGNGHTTGWVDFWKANTKVQPRCR